MIRAHCFTNLDEFSKAGWPTQFAFPPRVGDKVEGFVHPKLRPVLKVVAVTHCSGTDGEPFVNVELHR